MAAAVLRIGTLPDAPLEAAAAFYASHLAPARASLAQADSIVIVFPAAGHEHRAWRLAAVQELAREAAPRRVNAIAGGDEAAAGEALAYLEASPGVTGQLLALAAAG